MARKTTGEGDQTIAVESAERVQVETRQEAPEMTAVDLFAGAGGISLGVSLAGLTVVHAVERNSSAAATYRQNNTGVDVSEEDVRLVSAERIRQGLMFSRGELTMLCAGPPCQGFSESNRRTRTGGNKRNYLFTEVARWAAEFKPKVVLIENVTGLLTLERGMFVRAIVGELDRLGYESAYFVLDASDFGVPQFRRRLFIVGCRSGESIAQLREAIRSRLGKGPAVTVREAISDLPRLENGASMDVMAYLSDEDADLSEYQRRARGDMDGSEVSGNLVTRNSELVLKRYGYIPQGGNWEAIPEHLMANYADRSRCHTGIYYRLVWDQPAKVIGNYRKNMLIHPEQDRGLSVREAARLQSFPDRYCFCGSIGFQQQQVADAVPPFLARGVAGLLKASIETGSSGESKRSPPHVQVG